MKNEKHKEVYNREFKLKHLGYGEWLEEPDIIEFEYRGIKCLVIRVLLKEIYAKDECWFGGYFCGYIFLPKEHPLYGKNIEQVDLNCHFGVTFAEVTEEGHKIGFDCAHFSDLIPSMVELRKRHPLPQIFTIPKGMENLPLFKPIYRNMSFCIKQCKQMVKQSLQYVKHMCPDQKLKRK